MHYRDPLAIDARNNALQNIYKFIYTAGRCARSEVAHRLGLSLPTVIQNTKQLLENGLIYENGRLDSSGGRKAVALSCRFSARHALGLDLTRGHVGIVLIDLAGTMVGHRRIRRAFEESLAYSRFLGDLVNDFVAEHAVAPESILGLGVSVPGFPSADGDSLQYSHVLRAQNLKSGTLVQGTPYAVTLCNDANAAGIAELWGRWETQDAVYLSLSNTVGGAIFTDGALLQGDNQRGGEVGHMTLVPHGLPCYCGKLGCVDSYCSALVLAEKSGQELPDFFDSLRAGGAPQKELWNAYLEDLAVVVNNLRMAFDCQVILGGFVGAHLAPWLPDIQTLAAQRNTFEADGGYIVPCRYKVEAAAVGAALLPVARFIEEIR